MIPAIFGLSGPTLSDDERAFFREAEPAGFILYGRNVGDPEQVRALTDALRALSGRAAILVDQEGGRCSRLGPPHWPAFPAAARFGDLYRRAPISGMEAARANALATALVLAEAGITMNCAPSLDLQHGGAHRVIGDRAFGSDPSAVAALGRAVLDGLAEGGVTGIVKHMPGHGRAPADSHEELPVVPASAEELEADLAPFRALAPRARAGMTAHILFAAWDKHRPATVSPVVIEKAIRGRIGFDGLLISDDIVMEALAGTQAERAGAALAAGCDLVLHGSGLLEEAQAVAAALPPIALAAAERLARAVVPAPDSVGDVEALVAKRDALLGLIG